MTAPIEVTGSDKQAQPDAVLEGLGRKIEGRSLGQIAWLRLRRDKVAIGGGVVVLVLILAAVFATWPFGGLIGWLAHDPNEPHEDLLDSLGRAQGPLGGISKDFLLGMEPQNGRDMFARVLEGARYSLLIAFLATVLSVAIGAVFGMIAGYFGGWVDTLIGRTMDVFLAFPLLLFAIALAGAMPDEGFGLEGTQLRVAILIFIIGFFNWPYIGRIIRGQTISLREREFVDAARSMGARSPYILFREVLPNLVGPILVYSTLLIPTNILFEAALSFLGVGIRAPTATWGGMLADSRQFYEFAPNFMLVPGMAIFIAVLAFNLLGDGLRDALDPRAR